MENPWTTKSIKEVYDNPWISVSHREVITPNQTEGIYGKVHFKNKAIGIIPLDQDGNTWLVGQYRYTIDAYSWEIPMGGGLIENDILDVAKRELQEETGLTAFKWTQLMKLHTSNSVTDEVGYVFLAEMLEEGESNFDPTEKLVIRKLPLIKAISMVMEGEITDAISIAGLLKVAKLLNI
ncbi:NUDIX domain-containing protein [Belliella buryatensis]|uniref:GDP-mannose pyrophosphatase n=1 Tax=Belliella buryatensis TaxID=1500549 RepID=A0A239AFA4_9BACT|nr:NUDIX hydrolase [Belliella buryatensis]SNR94031.1 NUDIX domain-containing protein [Belliella buryatensis]